MKLATVQLLLAVLLAGCQQATLPAADVKTPESARDTRQHVQAASVAVKAATVETAKLPELPAKGAISANLATATSELTLADKSAVVTANGAEKDAQAIADKVAEIAKLKQSDPVRKGLQWMAWCMIACGAILLALHWFWLKLDWGDDAGGACIAAGACIWTILVYEKPIMFAVLICAAGYAGYKVWSLWRDSRKTNPKVVKQ